VKDEKPDWERGKTFSKGEAVRNVYGETGVVINQHGTSLTVQPDRHTGSPEQWHADKTYLLNLKRKAKDAGKEVWMCMECHTGFTTKSNLQEHQKETGHWRTPTGNPIIPEGSSFRDYKMGKDEEPMKSVTAYCPACKGAQTHLLTPEGPKCKRCLAKGKDSPDNLLSTAQSQEIAGDRKAALDSYRKAASAFRSTGDQKREAIAREGIDECQRKLVGGVDSTYQHPSSGKVQAFDSADRALTSAIQRTRAGELVRMALDSKTGETVVGPAGK
jgi:hypothetical protein